MSSIAQWASSWQPSGGHSPELLLTRGSGEQVALLAKRFPSSLVLSWASRSAPRRREARWLIEPEPALFAASAQRVLALGVEAYLANPPREACVEGPSAEELEQAVALVSRRAQVEQGTLRAAAREVFGNLRENLPLILGEGIPLSGVLQFLEGRPVLVAGAGPSLTGVLDALGAGRERVFLLAASSALRPLHLAGIHPDAVAILEARDRRRHFEGVPESTLREMLLFADSSTHPAHLESPFAYKIIFHGAPGSFLAAIFGKGSLVPNGGNIGTAMLVIAWMLGARPVLAAGLDFAAPAGRHYAAGSGSEGLERAGEPLLKVPAWDGTLLEAGLDLVGYREETEALLAGIAQLDPEARFEAVTLEGARIAGMEGRGWEAAIAELPDRVEHGLLSRLAQLRSVRNGLFREPSVGEALAPLERSLSSVATDPGGVLAGYAYTEPADPLLSLLLGPELLAAREGEGGLAAGGAQALARAAENVAAMRRKAEELDRR